METKAIASGMLPKHERLRNYLLAELNANRLKPGDLLPAEIELAKRMNMARNTVRQALSPLERNGLIRRIRGKGTFVTQDARLKLESSRRLFALVVPDSCGGYYPSLQRGFGAGANALSKQIIVADTGNDPLKQADIILQLMDERVAGVAMVPSTRAVDSAHQIRALQDRGIPVVFCHRLVPGINAPLVTFDSLSVGQLAGEALLERGHRRVAFFGTQHGNRVQGYLRGLRQALRDGQGDVPDDLVLLNEHWLPEHEMVVRETLERMMSSRNRPSAIMASFDTEAELLYVLLGRMGIEIPDQLSLISFGGVYRENAIMRRLAAVVVNEEQLGHRATELLEEIRRGDRAIDNTEECLMPLARSEGETLGASCIAETVCSQFRSR